MLTDNEAAQISYRQMVQLNQMSVISLCTAELKRQQQFATGQRLNDIETELKYRESLIVNHP
jgi:hypothetical protein